LKSGGTDETQIKRPGILTQRGGRRISSGGDPNHHWKNVCVILNWRWAIAKFKGGERGGALKGGGRTVRNNELH